MDFEIRLLLEAFRNISFYTLGAGASANIVPMTCQLKSEIIKAQKKIGAYSCVPIPQDELTKRIIGPVPNDDSLLSRISSDYVLAIGLYQLAKHHWQKIEYTPQYDVFYFAKKPSTIFTPNLDGLAEKHKHGHYVHHFHGTIPKHFGSSKFFHYTQDHFAFFDLMRIESENIIFVKKEDFSITNNISYRLAGKHYMKCKFLIIIGYSFGANKFGIDDISTYNYLFKNLYSKNDVPILIISPDTYDLKNRIQDTVKSNQVYGIEMYWDCLSKALIDYFISFDKHKTKDCYHILKNYYYHEDKK
jgi:hypothetical protein